MTNVDLVTRLRNVSATGEASRCMGEAADRIEALESVIRTILSPRGLQSRDEIHRMLHDVMGADL